MAASALEVLFGPTYILLCFTFILYGLCCAQIIYYWTTYKDKDPLVLRLLIILLCVLETLHTVCCIHFSYFALVVNFSNPVALIDITWSEALAACIECPIIGIVQSYYSWRIWRLQKSIPTVCILFVIQLVRLAIGFRTAANVYLFGEWPALITEKVCQLYMHLYFSFNLGVDILIASLLVLYLYKARASAQRSTKKIMLKLTYYAIAAGAPTIIVAVIQLITYKKSDSFTFAGLLNANVKCKLLNISVALVTSTYSPRSIGIHKFNASNVRFRQYDENTLLLVLTKVPPGPRLNVRRRIVRTTESNSGYSIELPIVIRRDATSRPVCGIEVLQESITVDDSFKANEHFPRIDKSGSLPNELLEDYKTV